MKTKIITIIISILLWIVAITLGILSFFTVNSEKYSYYQYQRSECVKGYEDCMYSYYNDEYINKPYLRLAETYEDLIDKWDERIESLEKKAMLLGIGAGVAGVIAIGITIFAFKKRKVDTDSNATENIEYDLVQNINESEQVVETTTSAE